MIHEIKSFSIECDNCKEGLIEYETGFSIFSDKNLALESAMESGWENEDGKHYCPDCWDRDDDDKLILKQIKQ